MLCVSYKKPDRLTVVWFGVRTGSTAITISTNALRRVRWCAPVTASRPNPPSMKVTPPASRMARKFVKKSIKAPLAAPHCPWLSAMPAMPSSPHLYARVEQASEHVLAACALVELIQKAVHVKRAAGLGMRLPVYPISHL